MKKEQNITICNGCSKHCDFDAKPTENGYYVPTIDSKIITAYVESGKQKNIELCETAQKAIEVAHQISHYCCYHIQNAK